MWYDTLLDSIKLLRSRMPSQKAKRGRARRQPVSCKPAFESLEDRCVPAAMLSVSSVAIIEGNVGTQHAEVTVTLSEPLGKAVTVNYRTINGTAKAGSDYDAVSGKLTFAKGQTSKTILVPVHGDRIHESDESFFVRLENAKGAKIANANANVAIVDNEPRISISNMYATEGNAGETILTFTASLAHVYDEIVTLDYATADGTATTADNDYLSAFGSLTFEEGDTAQTFTVTVLGDAVVEMDESFFVNFTGASTNAVIAHAQSTGSIGDDDGYYDYYDYGGYYDYAPYDYFGYYDYGGYYDYAPYYGYY